VNKKKEQVIFLQQKSPKLKFSKLSIKGERKINSAHLSLTSKQRFLKTGLNVLLRNFHTDSPEKTVVVVAMNRNVRQASISVGEDIFLRFPKRSLS
jgi:hypothetical protein